MDMAWCRALAPMLPKASQAMARSSQSLLCSNLLTSSATLRASPEYTAVRPNAAAAAQLARRQIAGKRGRTPPIVNAVVAGSTKSSWSISTKASTWSAPKRPMDPRAVAAATRNRPLSLRRRSLSFASASILLLIASAKWPTTTTAAIRTPSSSSARHSHTCSQYGPALAGPMSASARRTGTRQIGSFNRSATASALGRPDKLIFPSAQHATPCTSKDGSDNNAATSSMHDTAPKPPSAAQAPYRTSSEASVSKLRTATSAVEAASPMPARARQASYLTCGSGSCNSCETSCA
mmetsp:Transcript_50669/g.147419  ORF Transcript_50669/g.147419 Transcript_50669/m.147419 type:complete len:293 (-) Transcript_50669:436-1314(-)